MPRALGFTSCLFLTFLWKIFIARFVCSDRTFVFDLGQIRDCADLPLRLNTREQRMRFWFEPYQDEDITARVINNTTLCLLSAAVRACLSFSNSAEAL